jgi:predicted nucleic acid-binding protein
VAAFDVAAALRWARFDPGRTLARRPDEALPFAGPQDLAGRPLLLDTCVYIDQMQGRAPASLEQMVMARQVNHSSVAVQELMHAVGRLDPADRRTAAAVAAMPDHRIFTPDLEVLGRAALLAGLLTRTQGYGRDARLRALQDAVLYLQARKSGFTVLTRNLADFDLILQLMPAGRVLFYRVGAA